MNRVLLIELLATLVTEIAEMITKRLRKGRIERYELPNK